MLPFEVPTAGSSIDEEVARVNQEEDNPEHIEDVKGQKTIEGF